MATHRYQVDAAADPGVLCQLLNYFARADIVPATVSAARAGDGLQVVISQPGLDCRMAAIIAEKMRQLIGVRSVGLEHGGTDVPHAAQPLANVTPCASGSRVP